MIKYEWCTALESGESAELAEMLSRAADHDAEAEHNSIDFASVRRALESDERVRILLIRMLPHTTGLDRPDEPERIAGLVRLVFSTDSEAEVTTVVDPRLRSIGILTLLLEQVGVDPDAEAGWFGSGARVLHAWARGNHPAAERISKRFLIPSNNRVWKLIRPVDSLPDKRIDSPAAQPAVLSSGRDGLVVTLGDRSATSIHLDPTPSQSDEFGRYATIDEVVRPEVTDANTLRALLDSAAASAASAGLDAIAVHVESSDRTMVNACRLTGFCHDRTDVRYQIGGN